MAERLRAKSGNREMKEKEQKRTTQRVKERRGRDNVRIGV